MIHYALICADGHEFEAWFASSESYGEQAEAGALSCPLCGTDDVGKALMTPRMKRPVADPAAPARGAEKIGVVGGGGGKTAELLGKLRTFVEDNCEHVGERFTEEARKIHYGEAEERGIYGDASPDEAAELADEGIPVGRLPWRKRHDA